MGKKNVLLPLCHNDDVSIKFVCFQLSFIQIRTIKLHYNEVSGLNLIFCLFFFSWNFDDSRNRWHQMTMTLDLWEPRIYCLDWTMISVLVEEFLEGDDDKLQRWPMAMTPYIKSVCADTFSLNRFEISILTTNFFVTLSLDCIKYEPCLWCRWNSGNEWHELEGSMHFSRIKFFGGWNAIFHATQSKFPNI